jgi:hypothetical protein
VIGHGHRATTLLDDLAHLELAMYVQQGIERMAERHGFTDTPEDVLTFLEIAKHLSMSEPPLRTSALLEASSSPSVDLEMEVTVAQVVAEKLLPWCEVHIRRKIRSGEIPITRTKPYLLNRAKLAAINASLPETLRSSTNAESLQGPREAA